MKCPRPLLLVGCTLLSTCLAAPAAPPPKTPPSQTETRFLGQETLAKANFGNDAAWFKENIPFFECSDAQIQQVYYYRWKLYKAHLKDLGDRGYIVTEFLDDVGWSLKPYESLNDATGFHISEGRWLRNPRYVGDYINFMYSGGNDRHFSEAIADATYDTYLVSGDPSLALKNLPEMKRIYRQWDDHLDPSKGLYFIEPLLDATEYTISSVDASGGKDGFFGGDGFRPSINSFMFANANAISNLSRLQGDTKTVQEYAAKAADLRARVQRDLWNTDFRHFIDRYKVNNQYVTYWNFIRGRELAGYTPWYFGLPDRSPQYVQSWSHLLAPDKLGGPQGMRTVEPSYEYYMKQYRYVREDGINKPECQWNGPSWPFQTTLALGGMANLLHDYPKQSIATNDDYLRLLRQYTRQHYLNGEPDLQEDYDPSTGKVIVGLRRSHHYNHSGYNDLIISGLVGLRPRADNTLEVNPLVPANPKSSAPITYFCLENVRYHGRLVTILYDRDGKRYNRGKGLPVYVSGQRVVAPSPLGKKVVSLGKPGPGRVAPPSEVNVAVNLNKRGYPLPLASTNGNAAELQQAVDGRVWYFPNVRNYWTNTGSTNSQDWFSVDFGHVESISRVHVYFYRDDKQYKAPTSLKLQYWNGTDWADATASAGEQQRLIANGENILSCEPVSTSKIRVVFDNPPGANVALVEMKAYGEKLYEPIDDLVTGDAASETAHNFQGTNSTTGKLQYLNWRDAQNGGSFSFDLKTAPRAQQDLIVRYWGSEVGNRNFSILVDSEKIADQTLNRDQPDQFFEQPYPLPLSLTRGKQKVRITFQAKPSGAAGGIFGSRMVRRTNNQ